MKYVVKHFVSFSQKVYLSAKSAASLRKSASKRVYLDNAGATEVGERAKHALIDALATYGNPSAIHAEGAHAGVSLDKARALCATVINAHSYEVYFTSSGTESCNLAVLGVYEAYVKNNREAALSGSLPHMVVSSIEHPAVLEPVRALERAKKIRVTYLPVYENGIVKVHDVVDALSLETILVSVMYANNEIGTLQPVKEIGRAIDEWKTSHDKTFTSYPYFHTDACQAANYCNLDVLRIKAHLMTVNSSKVYGPKGAAFLYKREGVAVAPVTYGGGQERELRSGTENVAAAYAFGVALTEAKEISERESERLRVLRDEAVRCLKEEIPSIIFYGAFDEYSSLQNGKEKRLKVAHRLPNNINCRVPGISSEEMILRLDAKGYAVSHKSACASMETDGSYVITALGYSEEEAKENIRISLGRSTTKSDLDGLVLAIKDISTKYIH
jgi:cysteine desulfurase